MAISHRHRSFEYPEYISPLPADELIKIGTIKQSLYNEGVDKIQKRIDELDKYGFDLVKEEDKKYFSQEMDKFIKSVNTSAAKTDFSVLPNVRNILSIGRPIENDPNILNAIQSTAEYRRRQQELAKIPAKDRGPANDWAFMNDANEWLNDGKVGSKLSSGKTYTPYVNPAEYVMDAVKKMEPIIKAQVIDDGKGFLRDYEVKELTQQRLKEWMETSLPPQIINQIRLDAEYEIKDIDDGQLQNYYFDKNYKHFETLNNLIGRYEQLGQMNADEQKNYKSLLMQREITKKALQGAPENSQDAKAILLNQYYQNFITGQAEAYAYRQEKESWKAQPYRLADYMSSLRKAEMKERNKQSLDLYEKKMKIMKDLGMGKFKPKAMTQTEKKALTEANVLFKKFTNQRTNSKDWVDVTGLSADEQEKLNQILTSAAVGYVKDFSDKDLEKIQVKQNPDGTYMFRLSGNSGMFSGDVKDIYQDRFEDAFRDNLLIGDDLIFEGSIDNVINQVPSTGSPAHEQLSQLFNTTETADVLNGTQESGGPPATNDDTTSAEDFEAAVMFMNLNSNR